MLSPTAVLQCLPIKQLSGCTYAVSQPFSSHQMPRVLSDTPDAIRARQRRAAAKARLSTNIAPHSFSTLEVRARHRTDIERERDTARKCVERERRKLEGLSFAQIAAYCPSRINTPWRPSPCAHCGALLLTSDPRGHRSTEGSNRRVGDYRCAANRFQESTRHHHDPAGCSTKSQ